MDEAKFVWKVEALRDELVKLRERSVELTFDRQGECVRSCLDAALEAVRDILRRTKK